MAENDLRELRGRNIVVYDLEIKRIPGEPGCSGWNDHKGMGISVGCAYDYRDGDYKVFLEDNMPELATRLNEAELIVAFNQLQFDNRVLRGCGYKLNPDNQLKNYDMLYESRIGTGWREGQRFPSGLKLDNHLEGCFGAAFKKTDSGAMAPKYYQDGEIGRLITYCLADVRRERSLFEFIWTRGFVKTSSGHEHRVADPKAFLNGEKNG